jgi:hypothetical protein
MLGKAKEPIGLDFLRLVSKMEDQCEKLTDKKIPAMGKKAPRCMEHIGTVLSLCDRIGSCYWQCNNDDHLVEYMTSRVNGYARASLRLARFGFYDEALVLVRSIGEIANLLVLFMSESTTMDEWRNSDHNMRINSFKPSKIRERIEKNKFFVPMDANRYRKLCEIATHPVPHLKPQDYNPIGKPSSGGRLQEAGFVLVINELAFLISIVSLASSKLCRLPADRLIEINKAALACTKYVGSIDVKSYRDLLRSGG